MTQPSGQGLSAHGLVVADKLSNTQIQAERKRLLASLRGKKLHIPSLKPLFYHWPAKTNDCLELTRHDIREWLQSTIAPGKVLDGLLASDFGLFGATWWPCAQFDKLRIVTYLAVWLFTWDDQFDLNDGSMWDEFGTAQVCRRQTIAYIRYTLGIATELPYVQNQIILNFKPIGIAVRQHYDLGKRHIFLQEMVYYIEMPEQEQRLRLSGAIASLEEFWHYRLGSSAVTVCLSLNEFSWDEMNLPTAFYSDDDVQLLYRYTNTIISAVNDLLSIKKEIEREAIDSFIPIIFYEIGDIQLAVEQVVGFIKDEIKSMDNVATSLLAKYSKVDATIQEQIRLFIEGCKYYVTGNMVWSLETDRYGVIGADDGSGDIIMIL